MSRAGDIADAMIDKMLAEQAAENEKVEVTQQQIDSEAKFLLGWARDKNITKVGEGSSFYARGNKMTKLYPAAVRGLLASGYAVGSEYNFTMVKDKVKGIK